MPGLDLIKKTLWNFIIVRKIVVKTYTFLCIITPVFDPAYESLCQLVAELHSQTFGRFIHVMISNGPSPKIKSYVLELNRKDPRFIYDDIQLKESLLFADDPGAIPGAPRIGSIIEHHAWILVLEVLIVLGLAKGDIEVSPHFGVIHHRSHSSNVVAIEKDIRGLINVLDPIPV